MNAAAAALGAVKSGEAGRTMLLRSATPWVGAGASRAGVVGRRVGTCGAPARKRRRRRTLGAVRQHGRGGAQGHGRAEGGRRVVLPLGVDTGVRRQWL
jgi:hypothetical protein